MTLSYSFLLLHSVASLLTAIHAAPYQGQTQLTIEAPDDWQKYVRSPSSRTVRPVAVLSNYTQGNVTNVQGLLTGKGSTLLSRSNTSDGDVLPLIVVDWGQNHAGFLTINFGGSSNSTPGRPGIRLSFSETLEYLLDNNLSDFTRSYNVGLPHSALICRLTFHREIRLPLGLIRYEPFAHMRMLLT